MYIGQLQSPPSAYVSDLTAEVINYQMKIASWGMGIDIGYGCITMVWLHMNHMTMQNP